MERLGDTNCGCGNVKDKFIESLMQIEGHHLFNPLTDVCPLFDKQDAPLIRQKNLRIYLDAIDKCGSVVFGEAGGYNGYRKTGLAFTSDLQLPMMSKVYNLPKLNYATKSGRHNEMSATFVWKIIPNLVNPPFIWNIVPMHPHAGSPMTNRTPNKKDHEVVRDNVELFLKTFKFDRYFAIGRVAEKKLKELGYDVTYIRHPSYGGDKQFTAQMYEYFEKIERNHDIIKYFS